jgi:hypothetical protein
LARKLGVTVEGEGGEGGGVDHLQIGPDFYLFALHVGHRCATRGRKVDTAARRGLFGLQLALRKVQRVCGSSGVK